MDTNANIFILDEDNTPIVNIHSHYVEKLKDDQDSCHKQKL